MTITRTDPSMFLHALLPPAMLDFMVNQKSQLDLSLATGGDRIIVMPSGRFDKEDENCEANKAQGAACVEHVRVTKMVAEDAAQDVGAVEDEQGVKGLGSGADVATAFHVHEQARSKVCQTRAQYTFGVPPQSLF
ncbi:hypothetical protein ACFL3F_01880 [Planctomycetota bacterium]